MTMPQDDFEDRVRTSFGRQALMATIGARLIRVSAGEVAIELPFRADLTQQHGFVHAGIVTAVVDTACGYAAYSLMPEDAAVLTVEYKVNFLAPAEGDRMVAIGRVIKAGRTISVCTGEALATIGGREKLVAAMQATMMAVRGRANLAG